MSDVDTTIEDTATTEDTNTAENTTNGGLRQPAFKSDQKITLGADKEGNRYGPDNNPKREGSASAARFALYQDGMTVGEAMEAGVTRGDINWDAKHDYISVE